MGLSSSDRYVLEDVGAGILECRSIEKFGRLIGCQYRIFMCRNKFNLRPVSGAYEQEQPSDHRHFTL